MRPFQRTARGLIGPLFLVSFLNGDNSGRLVGRVIDGAANLGLANANVLIPDLGLGTATDEDGNFYLPDLPTGSYRIEATVIGYEKSEANVEVKADGETAVVLKLLIEPLFMEGVEIQGLLSSRLSREKVEVITSEQIAEREIHSLSELLASLPGVDVQAAHSFGRNVNVSIRGSSDYKPGGYNNRVLLLLDGFPIHMPNSGAPDWNAIPLDNVQRVEVLHGPSSALYGQNSMGGVINLITRESRPQSSPSAKVSLGNYKTGKIAVSAGGPVGSFDGVFNLSAFSSDGHRFNAESDLRRFSGRLHRRMDNGGELSISTILAQSTLGHTGFVVPEQPSLVSYRLSERSSRYLQLHHRKLLDRGQSWNTSLALHSFLTHYRDRSDTPVRAREDDTRYDDLSLAGRSEILLVPDARFMVLIGMEGAVDQSDVTVMNPMYGTLVQQTVAPFIQSRASLGQGWSLVGGLRYDYRYVIPGHGYTERSFRAVSPKLSFTYREPTKRLFHLSVNKGFRAPSLSELYLLHASSYGLFLQGTPTLKPETVWALETGYKHEHSPDLNWKVELFYNHYRDMIDFVYGVPVKAQNWKSVTASGGEFQINTKLSEGVLIGAHYSFLSMTDLSGTGPLLYRPKHKFNTAVTFRGNKVSAGVAARFVSRQRYEDFLSHDYDAIDSRVVFPLKWLPQRFLMDANVSYGFRSVDVSLKVENLLDTDYALIQNYPMQGRTWTVTLSSNLEKQGG